MVDAAYRIPGKNEYYIFAGRNYGRVRFTSNSHENSLVAGPTLIRKGWNTMSKVDFGRVDTVVPVPGTENQLYVFFGGRYIKIKLDNYDDSFVTDGVHHIESGWKSLVQAGFDTVDAAVLVPGTKNEIYFFRGLNYVRVDNATDKMARTVTPIKDGWPSIAKAGFDTVDAIVPSLNHEGHFYVFSGDQYAVIALDHNKEDTLVAASKLISDGWKSMDKWV
ncbi:uncharacterized protein N7529_005725 [Penicillium soppii]|jgi:hypothetical protein|uniref:uncharacterized protein n=1 Tax=Penicillium soppii TaxID=69789 RepID=UPI002548B507|nr:uncharacterized protein N7529_005725 [Penicillium soppii]KAJ5863809.1 hypothetical protein N7529_005725 [Penicillium soppii]